MDYKVAVLSLFSRIYCFIFEGKLECTPHASIIHALRSQPSLFGHLTTHVNLQFFLYKLKVEGSMRIVRRWRIIIRKYL